MKKMSVDEIRKRYDGEVDRFSNISVGQTTTVDSTVNLSLMAEAAARSNKNAKNVLDIGCGAGNATLNLLYFFKNLNCDLLDLSENMLFRAKDRVSEKTTGNVNIIQNDLRIADLKKNHYDIILAATVLHHLREETEWHEVFSLMYDLLKPGGTLWITDLVNHEIRQVQDIMWNRYGDYLIESVGVKAKEKCFKEIELEDTPKPLTYQIELLRSVGFKNIDIVHKNSCFATFGAIK